MIRVEAERLGGTEVFYEYSPESFTGTEAAICHGRV